MDMGQKLHNRIETWKKLLLDLGKRNRLINFREGKRSCVKVVSSYDFIYDQIVVHENDLAFPYSKKVVIGDDGEEVYETIIPGNIETTKTVSELQKTLKVLRYRANTSIEEQGINILFLAFGLLKWRESDDSTVVMSSPIVLVPVKLTIASLTSPYVLSPHEDEIVINPTLQYKLENDFGIKFPEFDSTKDDISAYFDECNRIVENKGWSIERSVYLSNLSFLKINMYKDLERNEERLEDNEIISALVGEKDLAPISDVFNNFDHDKNERPIDVFQVVDADSSQQDAILLSKKGASFVLQGPPGTGKSQTITNIISEALADGKKVLFVSEKMAALQVVYNRLSNVGLSDFCFTLHSHKANKKEILRDLEKSIHIDRMKVREEALAQFDILEKKREELNKYQEELHTPCSALNLSIYEINGKLAKLEAVPDLIFSISDVEKTSTQELNNKVYLLHELSKTIEKRSEDYDKNVWRGASVDYLSNELRHDIDSNVSELIPLLTSLDETVSKGCSVLELSIPRTIDNVEWLLKVLLLAKDSPLIPERWISENMDSLFSETESLEKLANQIVLEKKELAEKYKQEIFGITAELEKNLLIKGLNKASSVLRYSDNNSLANHLDATRQQLHDFYTITDGLFEKANAVAIEIGMVCPINLRELCLFESILNWLVQNQEIRPSNSWFDKESYNRLKQSLPSIKELHNGYANNEKSLLSEFDKEILDIDCNSILKRFKEEYDTVFRFLKGQYKQDIHLIRGCTKNGKKVGYTGAIEALTLVKEIVEKKAEIDSISKQCKDDYGNYYQGVNTQWERLQNDIEEFGKLLIEVNEISPKLKNLIIEGNLPYNEMNAFLKQVESALIKDKLIVVSNVLVASIDKNKCYTEILENVRIANEQSKDFADGYGKLRALRREDASFDTVLGELDKLESCQKGINLFEKRKDELASLYGGYYNGMRTDWDKLCQALRFAKDFQECIKTYSLPAPFVNKVCTDSQSVAYCSTLYESVLHTKEKIDKPLSWFGALFEDETEFEKSNLLDLANYLNDCKDKKNLLEEWVDYCTNKKKCEEAGLSSYIEQINNQIIDCDHIVYAYLKRFYRLWLDKMLQHHPAIRDFRRRIQEQNISEFCNLDIQQFKISQARVRERLISRIPDFDSFTTSRDEIGILKRELNKQRRIMPLRKLFMAIPNLLPTLRPCFMMSPLSVSVFLEAQSYTFDLVIFDEASQVHTEDAVGAIMRGKQVIIVGDTKQLPPTNFFAASLNDDDFDVDADEELQDSEAGAYESILEEAVTVLPERSLRWHYRSRDEHLIAFSNIKIYNGSLITFPSSVDKAPDLGVEYIRVPNGVYDRSGKRNNVIEAKRVAELVFEHFKKHPNRSLGVVTFSEAQQNAVDVAIRQLRLKDSSMEKFFEEDKEEPFFVKNLENVQGDERDTIIFSIGYAKDSKGIMYMNFGPLSREGGYRRLNVAITRAKYNVKLVGSIVATDIDLEKTTAEGVKLLRSYIDYAQRGIAALENEISYTKELHFDSPFEEAVYDFLCSKGYEVVTQVGCSGFRIDMAIKHPIQNGKFAIGIECDGAMYHSSRTARERDRLRQTVLEDMGWKIYRIWSTDWIKNQKYEEDKLVEAIDMALSEISVEKPVEKAGNNNDSVVEIEEKVETRKTTGDGYGFDFYQELPLLFHRGNNEVETIKNVIKAYQPIHFEALCRILAPLWGRQKATNVIRDTVSYYLMRRLEGGVKRDGDFIALMDFSDLKVRVPDSPENVRPIELICDAELAMAMKTIIQHSFGITPENLITETARVFGFKRTGGKISATLKRVYEKMIESQTIKEVDGKVCVI